MRGNKADQVECESDNFTPKSSFLKDHGPGNVLYKTKYCPYIDDNFLLLDCLKPPLTLKVYILQREGECAHVVLNSVHFSDVR